MAAALPEQVVAEAVDEDDHGARGPAGRSKTSGPARACHAEAAGDGGQHGGQPGCVVAGASSESLELRHGGSSAPMLADRSRAKVRALPHGGLAVGGGADRSEMSSEATVPSKPWSAVQSGSPHGAGMRSRRLTAPQPRVSVISRPREPGS